MVSKVHNYLFSENQEIFQKNTRFLAFYGSKMFFFGFLIFVLWLDIVDKKRVKISKFSFYYFFFCPFPGRVLLTRIHTGHHIIPSIQIFTENFDIFISILPYFYRIFLNWNNDDINISITKSLTNKIKTEVLGLYIVLLNIKY